MKYAENILGLVGHTPLVKLNRLTNSRMATVLAKLENLNPGGSDKDRMAVNMVRRAEEAGREPAGISISVFAFEGANADALKRYRDMGVDRVVLIAPRREPEALAFLDRLAGLIPAID